jgi:16S rRNA C967 or C1407 C5-methylase (RsmB/RsmF family)
MWCTQLYGIDAASGAAVAALEVSHCDHVLDLCAAPGNSSSLPVNTIGMQEMKVLI